MDNFSKLIQQFDYQFPQELIAQEPARPRDSAKLIIYNKTTQEIDHDIYKNLWRYLPKDGVLVLNKTKVLPARLIVSKQTGGKVKLLYIKAENNLIWFLSNNKLTIGSVLSVNKKISFQVTSHDKQFYILKPSFKVSLIFDVLNKFGETPLPPYIKHSPLKGKKLLTEYNTVFANKLGSVAAPTASLHFTKKLLDKILKSGVSIKYVTLHVNLGTFASLNPEQLKSKTLHTEYYEIDKSTAKFLNKAKKSNRPIIAVGTTVVRTLESACDNTKKITKLSGGTNLFITENYKLKFVDQLITNFHVPKSSLLMLVSTFVTRKKLLALYKLAIKNKYRLFSFGDGMLIK